MENSVNITVRKPRSALLSGALLLSALSAVGSPAALADNRADGFYGGLKVAYFDPEIRELDAQHFDGPDNVGVLLGHERRYRYGYGGAELDFTTTYLDGSVDAGPVSADTLGAFVVYRTIESRRVHTGPYFKFKAGAYHYDAEVGDLTKSLTTGAFGVGFGINMYVVRFELELLIPEKDLNFVSFHILF